MGGSSSFRAEGYSSNPGIYIHTAAEYKYSVMRNTEKVGPSSLSRRDEVPPLSGFQDAPYLSTQLAAWTPGSKTSRDQQPVAQCLQPCSFPVGSVKEEAFCCLYRDGSNKRKQTTESATYIRLGDNSCRPEQTATSSGGCFQVCNGEKPQQDEQQFPSGFSLVDLGSSVESATGAPISSGKSAQETARELSKTDESQSRKPEKATSDSCSDNSDEEMKGRLLLHPRPPPPRPPLGHTRREMFFKGKKKPKKKTTGAGDPNLSQFVSRVRACVRALRHGAELAASGSRLRFDGPLAASARRIVVPVAFSPLQLM